MRVRKYVKELQDAITTTAQIASIQSGLRRVALSSGCAQPAMFWWGNVPIGPAAGKMQPKARVSAAMQNLEDAGGETRVR